LNEVRTFPVERSSRRRVESREEIRIVEGEVGEGVREVIGPAGTAQTTKGHEAMRIERRCLGSDEGGRGRTTDEILLELAHPKIILSYEAIDRAGDNRWARDDKGGYGIFGFTEGLDG
jgi:hypothetical protein